jgi:hypothetical protein
VATHRIWDRAFHPAGLLARDNLPADNLECPEIGPGRVPDLIGDATGSGLVTAENRVELANEINYSINRLQTSHPNISSTDMQNVLIAAYCRVVAHAPRLNASERWSRMRQFNSVLEQQIAANTLPPGTLIIANISLPISLFRLTSFGNSRATLHPPIRLRSN